MNELLDLKVLKTQKKRKIKSFLTYDAQTRQLY